VTTLDSFGNLASYRTIPYVVPRIGRTTRDSVQGLDGYDLDILLGTPPAADLSRRIGNGSHVTFKTTTSIPARRWINRPRVGSSYMLKYLAWG